MEAKRLLALTEEEFFQLEISRAEQLGVRKRVRAQM